MEVAVIIVGMNPARERNSKKNALSRLYNWLDELDLDYVSFTNLSADSKWNFDVKTIDKNFLYNQLFEYKKVIALGGLVSNYLAKYLEVDHFKLPHPSYRNRQLNDLDFEKQQLIMCRNYLNA
jgi:hypothetical protein